MSQSGRAAWSVITATAIGISLWSLVDGAIAGPGGAGCCIVDNGTACTEVSVESLCINQNGNFSPGEVCGEDNISCREPLRGCCEHQGICTDGIPGELPCLVTNGTFFEDQICAPPSGASAALSGGVTGVCVPYTPTATATATATASATSTATSDGSATATATATMIPDGGECTDPVDCESGNCVDNVCCESACDGPNQDCAIDGLEGNCLSLAATAPAASNHGILVGLAALLVVGIVAFWRRRVTV